MRIVIDGGSGPTGSKLVAKPGAHGYAAVPASPNSGVKTLTGEDLADANEGASVVVDVSNSSSFEDAAVLEFVETSTAYFGETEHSFRLMPNGHFDVERSWSQ